MEFASPFSAVIQSPHDPRGCFAIAEHAAARGRRAEVAKWLERTILLSVPNENLQIRLAATLGEIGRDREAVAAYRAALAIREDLVEPHANMAASLLRLGESLAAEDALLRAVILRPDLAPLLANLAQLRAQRDDLPAALQVIQRSQRISGPVASELIGFATQLARAGQTSAAIRAFGGAICADPGNAVAYSNLAALQTEPAVRHRAKINATRALRIRSDYADAYNNLAGACEMLGDPSAAKEIAETCTVLTPGKAAAWSTLANAHLALGNLPRARIAIRRAIMLRPNEPRLYRTLSLVTKFTSLDGDVATMERLAVNASGLPERERAELHFALAKAYEDLRIASRRFDHLLQANAYIRATLNYDEAGQLDWFRTLTETVNPTYMDAHRSAGQATRRPIFIVGMPRSGTSLVEQILASHSQVYGAGEQALFSRLLSQRMSARSGVLETGLRALTDEDLTGIGRDYDAHMAGLAPTASHITDKMPGNFRFVGLIHLALPEARIIHIRRDPVDNCLSCFATLFSEGQEFSYDLRELGTYHRTYRQVMNHWRDIVPAGALLEVDYETLVSDFDAEARRILDYCCLPWEEACAAFHRTDRVVRTASAAQVRQPLYQSSVGKIRPADDRLQPLFDSLEAR